MKNYSKKIRSSFLAFLTILIAISIPILALLITLEPKIEKESDAQSANLFPSLPNNACPEVMTRVQPNSQTPLTLEISLNPNDTFNVLAVSWKTETFHPNGKIHVLKPDGTYTRYDNNKLASISFSQSGRYTFVTTENDNCRGNYAYVNISGSTVSSTSSSTSSKPTTNTPPTVATPTVPQSGGTMNIVCPNTSCVLPEGYTKKFTNLQDALRETTEKGKIYIKNGTYQVNVFTTDTNPAQGAKELTIEGESKEGVIIDGSLNLAGVCNTMQLGKTGGIYLIKNLTIKSSGGCAGVSVEQNANFTADNVKVIDSKGAGIYFKGTSLGLIQNSNFETSTYAGVSLHETSKVKVVNSTFKNHKNQGVDLKDNSTGVFESNTFDGNGTTSIEQILLANSSSGSFKTNTFLNTKSVAILASDSSKVFSDRDIFDGTTSDKQIKKSGNATIVIVESPSKCDLYDFNKDKKVDLYDFVFFKGCYRKRGAEIDGTNCRGTDLKVDNWINLRDFVILRSQIKYFAINKTCK